jgi:hypothetical protein
MKLRIGPLVADPEDAAAPRRSRVEVYVEPRDVWVGAYVAVNAIYLCPLPMVVIRIARGEAR